MSKARFCFPLLLAILIPSCRSFEGLDEIERDTKVILRFDGQRTIGSASVIAPGVAPVQAASEGNGVFSFIRSGSVSRVPAWYCIVPARLDLNCDGASSVLSAELPSVQYPLDGACDKFSLLAISPAFNLGQGEYVTVQSPDSLTLPYSVSVSGLDAGSRVYSVSFTADSLAVSGALQYDVRGRNFIQEAGPLCHSLTLQIPDGQSPDSDGSVNIQAVSFLDFLDYAGPSRIFVSSENALYSLSIDTLAIEDGKLAINLAAGAGSSAAMSFDFNNSALYDALSASSSAKIIASDGTECVLELSSQGCVEKNQNGVCTLKIPAGQGFKVPAVTQKDVTGMLMQLTGFASDTAKFNVISADTVLASFSASTSGPNGGLTALSITDFSEEMQVSTLSGMMIVPQDETSRISGLVLTITDYVDPHSWEDGHIDDKFNDLFDIL